jgi:hypothetical protein
MIEKYQFGQIIIDGREYTGDVQVRPGEVLEWWRKQGHTVMIRDIEGPVSRSKVEGKWPETIVIGTGFDGKLAVPDQVIEHARGYGTEIIIEKTDVAKNKYNYLESQGKDVLGLFHLTC